LSNIIAFLVSVWSFVSVLQFIKSFRFDSLFSPLRFAIRIIYLIKVALSMQEQAIKKKVTHRKYIAVVIMGQMFKL